MSHTVREKPKLLARVRRIQGQAVALERALDAEKGCGEILHQIVAIRGAINGLMAEVIEDHVQCHVADPNLEEKRRREGAGELIDVIRTYMK
jgi:DNA-binding FrmR family transcriptional regulator